MSRKLRFCCSTKFNCWFSTDNSQSVVAAELFVLVERKIIFKSINIIIINSKPVKFVELLYKSNIKQEGLLF